MSPSTTELSRRLNIVYACLGYKIGKEFQRAQLDVCDGLKVQGVINATVGRGPVEEAFCGELFVGEDTKSSSTSGPSTSHLVALLLDQLSDRQQASIMREWPIHFAAHGELPAVDKTQLEVVGQFLKKLRSKTGTKPRKGNVVFQSHSPAAA